MNILRATAEHVSIIAPLFDAYRQFYRRASDPDGARSFIDARLQNEESVIFLAFDEDGTPLGFVQLYPSFSSLSLARTWILNDLFVDPAARRRGVGEALLRRAATFAVESEARLLTLATEITNTTAQRLYERMGWQRNQEFYYYNFSPEQKDKTPKENR